MNITIADTVRLENGRIVKVLGFGQGTVQVGWSNELGEYHRLWVPREKVLITREAAII